jgi:hypothetical protein
MNFLKSVIGVLAVVLCFGTFNVGAVSVDSKSTVQENEAPVLAFNVMFGNTTQTIICSAENGSSVADLPNYTQEQKDVILAKLLRDKFFHGVKDLFWRLFFIIVAAKGKGNIKDTSDFSADYAKQSVNNLLSGQEVDCKVRMLCGLPSKMLQQYQWVFDDDKEVKDVTSLFHGILSIDATMQVMHELLPFLEKFPDVAFQECITKVRAIVDKIENKQHAEIEKGELLGVLILLQTVNSANPRPKLVGLIQRIMYCCRMITGDFSREALKMRNLIPLFPEVQKRIDLKLSVVEKKFNRKIKRPW